MNFTPEELADLKRLQAEATDEKPWSCCDSSMDDPQSAAEGHPVAQDQAGPAMTADLLTKRLESDR